MSAEQSDSDMGTTPPEAINSPPPDVPNRSISKKARLKKAMQKQAIEELDAASVERTSTDMIKDISTPDDGSVDDAKTTNSTEATNDPSVQNESKQSPEKKLAPAPPRWRFVKGTKSTLGYSSKYAGVVINGKSSTELGAEYIAPEITKDVKVRTIEQFDLVDPPDEKKVVPKEDKEVGQFTIHELDKETEVFVGEGGLHHHIERASLPAPDSNRWKSKFPPTPGIPIFARIDGGESFGYESNPIPNPKDPPQFDHRPPGNDTPIDTNRVVGKLKFNPPDDNLEEFNGKIPKRKLFSAMNNDEATARRGKGEPSSFKDSPYDDSSSDNDNEVMEIIKPTHLYVDSSMTTTGLATSDDGGSNGDNGSELDDNFDDLDNSGKPISLHSISNRQRKWKRCRWLLIPLLILVIIIGAVVGKKTSSEGNETASSMVTEGFIFGVNDTSWPSQSTTVFLNPADTDASPLFSRPTFPPTEQPSLIPSLTPEPSASPSILPSPAPSGEPSSNPSATPSTTPSSFPTLVPSISPTSHPSMSPSSIPSVSPSQLPSESGSPTRMGSAEPSLSPSPSHHPSSYPSNHPITMSPSKQPITFMGGCPEPFEPFTSYIEFQIVSRDGVIYMCISVNCGSLTNAPGGLSSDQWRDTWDVMGSCNGTKSPTSSPTQLPSIASTETPSTTMTPTLQPIMFIGGCPGTFDPLGSYDIGSTISSEGIIYECISLFCRSLGLVPGDSNLNWREAWKVIGSCDGTIAPTLKPSLATTPAPLVPTIVPTVNPTLYPSKIPSPNPTLQPSDQPTTEPSPRPTTLKPVVVPTPMPTCPPQNGDFNLCIALDMSGSVCDGGKCLLCQPSTCNSVGINQQRCCNNFDNMLEFSKALVGALGDLKTQQDFSLVHFATDAEIASTLQNSNQAIKTLQQLVFSGGSTNLKQGITLCQQTMDSSVAGRKNLMLIVTDGVPSVPEPRPRESAREAAIAAKNKGTFIVPIFIEKEPAAAAVVEFMEEISSDAQVFLTDFDSIVSLKDIIFEQVICHT